MKLEIEAKFLNIDIDVIRRKLESLNATCQYPMRLMRRAVFHNKMMNAKAAYVRVRDEGDKTTLTYKQFNDSASVTGTLEEEVVVSNFESAVEILSRAGLSKDTYQETHRETWMLGSVEIVLDEWPWVNPFIEIEGPDELAVRSVANKLGFDWSDAVFGGVENVYISQYPHLGKDASKIINREIAYYRFEDPLPTQLQK